MLLFEKENKIKLCDFGSVETQGTEVKIKGTPRYLSPELFRCYISGQEYLDNIDFEKCDVFSLGVTFLDMLAFHL